MEAVGGSQEKEEATVDRHLDDSATAAATASEPAAAIDLFAAPTDAVEWISNEETVGPETTSPNQRSETSPGENKIDDTCVNNIRQPSCANGGVSLNFGGIFEANQESIHADNFNISQETAAPNDNFGLLGLPQTEAIDPQSDSSDKFRCGPPSDIDATEKDPFSEIDVIGLSQIRNPTQNLSDEQKPGETNAIPLENDAVNADVSAKIFEGSHHHSGPVLINSISEKVKQNASVIDEAFGNCIDQEEVRVPGNENAKAPASNGEKGGGNCSSRREFSRH